MWYLAVSLEDGSVLDRRHAHCWGYLFNGVYTAWWVCNRCAAGYVMSLKGSKEGYSEAAGELRVNIL